MKENEWYHLTFNSYNGFGFWYVNGVYRKHINLGQRLLPENTLKTTT